MNSAEVAIKGVGKTQLNILFQHTLNLEHDGQIASFEDYW